MELIGSDIGPAGAAALGASKSFPKLQALGLSRNDRLTCAGLEAIVRGESGAALRYLDLQACALGPDAGRVLADSGRLAQIQSLGLGENALGSEGTRTLCAGAHGASLRALSLHTKEIERDLSAVSTFAPHLEFLELSRNPFGPNGLRDLLRNRLDA
jgi:hypothetical protein